MGMILEYVCIQMVKHQPNGRNGPFFHVLRCERKRKDFGTWMVSVDYLLLFLIISHRIHGTGIFTDYFYHKYQPKVNIPFPWILWELILDVVFSMFPSWVFLVPEYTVAGPPWVCTFFFISLIYLWHGFINSSCEFFFFKKNTWPKQNTRKQPSFMWI